MNDTQDSMEDEEQERIKIDEKVESLAWLQQQFKDQLRSSQLNKMSQSFKSKALKNTFCSLNKQEQHNSAF